MACYIYDRDPQKYGGQQQNYLEESNKIIQQTTELFQTAKTKKEDFQEVFFKRLIFWLPRANNWRSGTKQEMPICLAKGATMTMPSFP